LVWPHHCPEWKVSPPKSGAATHILWTRGLANQSDFDYRTHRRNLCNKYIPAGTHNNQHVDLRECQRFVAHAERRRLSPHQTVKMFSEAFARIFVYVNAVTPDTCLDNHRYTGILGT